MTKSQVQSLVQKSYPVKEAWEINSNKKSSHRLDNIYIYIYIHCNLRLQSSKSQHILGKITRDLQPR